jgi:hypothetical protein
MNFIPGFALGNGGMAVEAVQRHRRIVVAGGTKLIVIIDGDGLMLVIVANVTFHAAGQAVLGGANPTIDGGVALMTNDFHMIAAHVLRRLDAVLEARRLGTADDEVADAGGLYRASQTEPEQRRQRNRSARTWDRREPVISHRSTPARGGLSIPSRARRCFPVIHRGPS